MERLKSISIYFIFIAILFNVSSALADGVVDMVVKDDSATIGTYTHLKYPSWGERTHFGVDILADEGSTIYAMAGGIVEDIIDSENDSNFDSLGYMVIIRHPSLGRDNGDIYSLYLHMQYAPNVNKDDYVHQGDIIGYIGRTGAANNTPHTHFEIRYFSDRFSSYNNIYASGDVRNEPYALNNWEDPTQFTVDWDWHGNGSIISYGSGDSTCWGCDRDEARVHPNIEEKGRLPEMQFQWQASERCRSIRLYEPDDNTASENDMVTIFIKPWNWDERSCTNVACFTIKTTLPYTISSNYAPINEGYNLVQIKFETDQPRTRSVIAICQ